MRTATISALIFAALSVASAMAGDLRYPQTGTPAFSMRVPDGWTFKTDDNGAMVIEAPDRSAEVVLSFAAFSGTLDQRAANVIKGTAAGEAPRGINTKFAGHDAEVFQTGMFTDTGAHTSIRLYLMRLDPDHVASVSVVVADDITDAQKAPLRALLGSAALAAASGH